MNPVIRGIDDLIVFRIVVPSDTILHLSNVVHLAVRKSAYQAMQSMKHVKPHDVAISVRVPILLPVVGPVSLHLIFCHSDISSCSLSVLNRVM